MRVRQTRLARSDVQSLYEFGFQEFGERVADIYVSGLFDLYDLIGDPYRSHIIIYRIDAEEVVILRVLNGKQDWQRILESFT